MNPTDDDLPPADAAESLRLIEQERARAERNLTPDPRIFLWPWGLAWLIGFGVYQLVEARYRRLAGLQGN